MKRIDYHRKNQKNSLKTTPLEWSFLLGFLLFVFLWSYLKPFTYDATYYFPDEPGRMMLPDFIFTHGSLPTGAEPEVQIPQWGFSYGYYPLFFGPLLSALLMKIVSFFTDNTDFIYLGARFVSVLAATGTGYFLLKIGKRFFGAPFQWLYLGMVLLIPQFIFLGAYINNDILAIFASAMIFYAWIWAYQEDWQLQNCLLLASGIIICALTYYNAYGWILASIIFFFGSWMIKHRDKKDWHQLFKYTAFIVSLVFIGIAFFFLRNLYVHGDLLGLTLVDSASELNGAPGFKPSERFTGQNTGVTLSQMLTEPRGNSQTTWLEWTSKSFIAYFGSMTDAAATWVYLFYAILYATGISGLLFKFIHWFRQRKKDSHFSLNILLGFNLLLVIIITTILSLYYSYYVDFQAQGRYLYPMLLAFIFLLSNGLIYLIQQLFKKKSTQKIATASLFVVQAAISVYCFFTVFL